MTKTLRTLLSLLALITFTGCASNGPPTTVQLTGSPGAHVTGFYIRDGHRVDLDGPLPITFSHPGLSVVAVRKLNPADSLSAHAQNPSGELSMSSPANRTDGLALELGNGFSGSYISPDQALSPPNNSLMTILPYWHSGTWVFDDSHAGLDKEPFVSGAPEIITALAKDIPNARAGFRLTFSANPFPTQQHTLTWLRQESGGNVYRLDSPKLDGWLCPALFHYFRDAPKTIYVRADPK